MTDLDNIIDEARLLKPGDVVAITTRRELEHDVRQLFLTELGKAEAHLGGVHFVLFEDVDLTVFRPVEDV